MNIVVRTAVKIIYTFTHFIHLTPVPSTPPPSRRLHPTTPTFPTNPPPPPTLHHRLLSKIFDNCIISLQESCLLTDDL